MALYGHEADAAYLRGELEKAREEIRCLTDIHHSLIDDIRDQADAWGPPSPGDPGHEVEGRVIRSELLVLADSYAPGPESS